MPDPGTEPGPGTEPVLACGGALRSSWGLCLAPRLSGRGCGSGRAGASIPARRWDSGTRVPGERGHRAGMAGDLVPSSGAGPGPAGNLPVGRCIA